MNRELIFILINIRTRIDNIPFTSNLCKDIFFRSNESCYNGLSENCRSCLMFHKGYRQRDNYCNVILSIKL